MKDFIKTKLIKLIVKSLNKDFIKIKKDNPIKKLVQLAVIVLIHK